MQSNGSKSTTGVRHAARGVSLIEMMVAMALGLALITIMLQVYLSSQTASRRQEQLSTIQNSVRIAFEYLGSDARMIGHQGCFTGKTAVITAGLPATAVASNFAIGVEGYNYTGTSLTLSSSNPADITTTANWSVNTAATPAINTIPVTTLGGAGGLTPGSDVLVMRSVVGRPVRLTAATLAAANAVPIESVSGAGCTLSGFCAGSYGLIASCKNAQFFSVGTIASSTLTLPAGSTLTQGYATTSEVFPARTIAYYVKRSSAGTAPALYRRIFDGTAAAGVEEELIDGVETLQIRYGIDTTLPDADGVLDSYVTAEAVGDWGRVVAVRMSLLLRSESTVDAALSLPASLPVNGNTVTFPTSGPRYDRQVFTTTVALRNRIAYF